MNEVTLEKTEGFDAMRQIDRAADAGADRPRPQPALIRASPPPLAKAAEVNPPFGRKKGRAIQAAPVKGGNDGGLQSA